MIYAGVLWVMMVVCALALILAWGEDIGKVAFLLIWTGVIIKLNKKKKCRLLWT